MIYLDYAASTPLHPLLQPRLADTNLHVGNSQSRQMQHLHQIIEKSKNQICQYFNGDATRLFFTSGATESINTAIIGAAMFYKRNGNHLITFETEHPSVLQTYQYLKTQGFDISILPIKPNGHIDHELLEKTITPQTILISLNHVCNETGHIHDLEPICSLQEKYGVMLHLDASQTIGKHPLCLKKHPIDFVSLSAHKCYGPQGIGALYIKNGRHIQPLIHGHHKVRSGTMSHTLIQLMGEAYEYAHTHFNENLKHVTQCHNMFLENLPTKHIIYNQNTHKVPHIANIVFPQATIEAISAIKDNIYCQQSSACFAGGLSHVLKARNISSEHMQRSIRFSFGITTTKSDITNSTSLITKILLNE